MIHFGSIRKYTAALLDLFNNFEIQYKASDGTTVTKNVPIVYSSREKSRILDTYTSEQLLSGNYSILPRASLSMGSMTKMDQRVTNKVNKINVFKSPDTLEYSFNSVPYEFKFDIVFQCRGMNEATQLIEQVAPLFNPTVNIDIWDAQNLNEPTRIPVRLEDISFESEEYDELSSNIFTVTMSIALTGNLYPPIKSQERIKQFIVAVSEVSGDEHYQKSLMNWDVDLDGNVLNGTIETGDENGIFTPIDTPSGIALTASKIQVVDVGDYFTGTTVEDILQEIGSADYQKTSEKGQPFGYAELDSQGKVPLSQLPSYGSEVVEYTNFASLPVLGGDSIYVTLDDNNTYTWDVALNEYVQIDSFVDLAHEATQLSAARDITVNLNGDTSGTASFDGTRDVEIYLNYNLNVITTDKILIAGNSATLPSRSSEIIKTANIYETSANISSVYECVMAADGLSISFDAADNLDGKFCTVRYFTVV